MCREGVVMGVSVMVAETFEKEGGRGICSCVRILRGVVDDVVDDVTDDVADDVDDE